MRGKELFIHFLFFSGVKKIMMRIKLTLRRFYLKWRERRMEHVCRSVPQLWHWRAFLIWLLRIFFIISNIHTFFRYKFFPPVAFVHQIVKIKVQFSSDIFPYGETQSSPPYSKTGTSSFSLLIAFFLSVSFHEMISFFVLFVEIFRL